MEKPGNMIKIGLAACLCITPLTGTTLHAAMQDGGKAAIKDIWKPAKTPKGGVSWKNSGGNWREDSQGQEWIYRFQAGFHPASEGAGRKADQGGWLDDAIAKFTQADKISSFSPIRRAARSISMRHPISLSRLKPISPSPPMKRRCMWSAAFWKLTGQDESGIFYRLKAASPS